MFLHICWSNQIRRQKIPVCLPNLLVCPPKFPVCLPNFPVLPNQIFLFARGIFRFAGQIFRFVGAVKIPPMCFGIMNDVFCVLQAVPQPRLQLYDPPPPAAFFGLVSNICGYSMKKQLHHKTTNRHKHGITDVASTVCFSPAEAIHD